MAQHLRTSPFRNPQVRANYEHLMTVAAEKGVEASVEEFRKLFSADRPPTEEQTEDFQFRAASKARWAIPGPRADRKETIAPEASSKKPVRKSG